MKGYTCFQRHDDQVRRIEWGKPGCMKCAANDGGIQMRLSQQGLLALLVFIASFASSMLAGLVSLDEDDLMVRSCAAGPMEVPEPPQGPQPATRDRLTSPDQAAAIRAGWRRVLRATPTSDRKPGEQLSRVATSRFLGLLEGRLRITIPETCEEAIQTAEWRSDDVISFKHLTPPVTTTQASDTSETAQVRTIGKRWLVDYGEKRYSVPADSRLQLGLNATVAIDGETAYVAVYDWPPDAYTIHAFEHSRIVWSSTVRAADGLLNYTGRGRHDVLLNISESHITVFGGSSNTIYIEMFERTTGEASFRFCTLELMR